MSEDRGRLRISNADRDMAIEQLQRALDEGRIDLGEFDERAKAVYGAKTNAELDILFEDLPTSPSAGQSVETVDLSPAESDEGATQTREGWSAPPILNPLIVTGCITITIWLLSSLASWELQYFWPAWPLGIMGAIAVAQWLTGRGAWDDEC